MPGYRGCHGYTNRKRRFCAQPCIVERDGKTYCYYHDPENPKKFSEGYKATVSRGGKAAQGGDDGK